MYQRQRHRIPDRQPLLFDQLGQTGRDQLVFFADDDGGGTDHWPGEEVERRLVEVQRREVAQPIVWSEVVQLGGHLGVGPTRPVGVHDALRRARGTRGEDDVGQVVVGMT